MLCQKCGVKLRVIDCERNEEEVYRRRRCPSCSRISFTIEFEVEPDEKYRTAWKECKPVKNDK